MHKNVSTKPVRRM